MPIDLCPNVERGGHTNRDHHCIGERGHPGPHWCLLGHIWPATDPAPDSEKGDENDAREGHRAS